MVVVTGGGGPPEEPLKNGVCMYIQRTIAQPKPLTRRKMQRVVIQLPVSGANNLLR